jgi:alpha-D-ribose 1-methylphosphonate 5-triphosphate synthase subunit PhnH
MDAADKCAVLLVGSWVPGTEARAEMCTVVEASLRLVSLAYMDMHRPVFELDNYAAQFEAKAKEWAGYKCSCPATDADNQAVLNLAITFEKLALMERRLAAAGETDLKLCARLAPFIEQLVTMLPGVTLDGLHPTRTQQRT